MATFGLFFDILRNYSQLCRGRIDISQRKLERQINRHVSHSGIERVEVELRKQCCMLSVFVKKSPLRYQYQTVLALTEAQLNTEHKLVRFRQFGEEIKADNLWAKAVDKSHLATFAIPDASFVVGLIVREVMKSVISQLVDGYVSNVVGETADSETTRDGSDWDVSIPPSSQPPMMYQPIKIPVLGARRLVGEIMAVHRLELRDGQIRMHLMMHPEIRSLLENKRHLLATLVGYGRQDVGYNGVEPTFCENNGSADYESRSRTSKFASWVLGRAKYGTRAVALKAGHKFLSDEPVVEVDEPVVDVAGEYDWASVADPAEIVSEFGDFDGSLFDWIDFL